MSKQSTFASSKPKKRVGRGQQYVQDFLLKKIASSDRLVGLIVTFVKGVTRKQCFYTKYAHVQGGGGEGYMHFGVHAFCLGNSVQR